MRLSFLLIGMALLVSCGGNKPQPWLPFAKHDRKWGYYSGHVEVRWENDGRAMIMLKELRYIDPQGVVWVAPAGSRVDGASVPRALWSFMGGPFEGKYRNASVLHDVAYDQKNKPWQDVDRMFYNAMRCSGVDAVSAKTMYYSLVRFGRHWKFEIKKASPVTPEDKLDAALAQAPRAEPVNRVEVSEVQDWIRSADPSLEQIDARADDAR